MTGIERLRRLARSQNMDNAWTAMLAHELCDIADQIEREQGGRVSRMRVLTVVTEMERHVLGHEGMEDSPVARWARELREALGGNGRDHAADVSVSAYDLLPDEDREAIAWVRERGGLDHVRSQWGYLKGRANHADNVDRQIERLQRQIDESHAALRRRNARIAELEHERDELRGQMAEMRPLLMPEGFEWPTYESGEPVMLGDSVTEYVAGGELKVRSVEFRDGATYLREGFRTDGIVIVRPGERVKRPAPKVLAGDNEPLYRGEYVWHEDGTKLMVLDFLHEEDDETIVKVSRVSGPTNWSECRSLSLTHERPDSWERIEEDAEGIRQDIAMYLGDYSQSDFEEPGDSVQSRVIDLVRRAKALAERERGE